MNHNTIPNPQFELPRPQVPGQESVVPSEAAPDLGQATEQRNIEQPAAPAPVSPAQAAQSVQDAAQAGSPGGLPIPAGIIPAAPPAATSDDDLVAEDSELIEKAWVQKAKEIVDRTRNDPYNQNREINKVKKDYIQKRYQKDVKITEE